MLYRAVQTMPWPGEAAVHVALLAARRADQRHRCPCARLARRFPARTNERRSAAVCEHPFELPRWWRRTSPFSGSHQEQIRLAFTGMFMRGPFDFDFNDPAICGATSQKNSENTFCLFEQQGCAKSAAPAGEASCDLDVWDALVARRNRDESRSSRRSGLGGPFQKGWTCYLACARLRSSRCSRSRDNADHVNQWWLFGRPRTELRAAWARSPKCDLDRCGR
jgi:hypothetical protein